MTKLVAILISMLTTCSVVPTDVPNEKIAYGTFTRVGEEGAQFKSYDDSVWWYLEYADIGEKPQVNKPYALIYDTNNTESCTHTDCDNCWREDDVLKKIKKIEKNY
jgi:hypothetical protein